MANQYSKNLSLLHALCLAEGHTEQDAPLSSNLDDYDPVKAASYLACYITAKAIKEASRSPADERYDNFDAELTNEELADIVESGMRKFHLIGDADAEHWTHFREDFDKAVIAFLVAGTDDAAPFEKEELIPVLGAFLSMLCEAFA